MDDKAQRMKQPTGFSLVELLVVIAIVGILASAAFAQSCRDRERVQLTTALRRLQIGLDRGRMAAERSGEPCGMLLTSQGWQPPLAGELRPCPGAATTLVELGASSLDIHSNLPDTVRFSSNGLVLDGGLVVLGHRRLSHHRCLVIGLPLGISRSGTYDGHPTDTFSSRRCKPDAEG